MSWQGWQGQYDSVPGGIANQEGVIDLEGTQLCKESKPVLRGMDAARASDIDGPIGAYLEVVETGVLALQTGEQSSNIHLDSGTQS